MECLLIRRIFARPGVLFCTFLEATNADSVPFMKSIIALKQIVPFDQSTVYYDFLPCEAFPDCFSVRFSLLFAWKDSFCISKMVTMNLAKRIQF